MELKTEKIKLSGEKLLRDLSIALKEKSGWILSLIFALVIGYSVYLWYIYAFNPTWDDAKKEEYIKTKQSDANFNEDMFSAVIGEVRQRKSNYQKSLNNVPNIFKFK
ncbi:MAG: hypothetical protein A2Z52_02900 [Candidatus Moranbacteria bacterium RBG_19FT_COMBO_42_6]|nr:MAG: hypothetical protein A2Z52_02900 [Candidatus Moranbacteria bacterium RBG_19FT_COMBO_42_6]